MPLPNIFSKNIAEQIIQRISRLSPTSQPKWGKMNVSQMLAHCNVAYEMIYEDKHPRPGFLKGFILKALVKKIVTGEKPFKHNSPTAPQFLVKGEKDFEKEKIRLIDHIRQTQQLGEEHFHGKLSHSFGKLSKDEWNNMFYKHLDHHLSQFGV